MVTRVEKAVVDGTNVVVGYGTVNVASYNAPVSPATQGTTTYSTQDAVVDVEIDYSSFYERIATALEIVASNSSTIKNAIDTSTPLIASFTGSISNGIGGSGTILTVSGVSGTITIGMKIIGGSVLSDTFITGGSGTTWSVSQPQNVSSSVLFGFSSNGYLTSLVSNISSKQTAIASQTTTMASNSTTITGLATGNGIHIIGAYDGFGMVTLYKLLVEQAKILDTSNGTATPEQIQASLNEITRVVSQIRSNIPKEF